jgi:dTDP-glucose 4,6-dehydratase
VEASLDTWKGKRVLVTGAGGFIGSHLTERLIEAGADVRALVHYNAMGRCGWLDHSSVTPELDVCSGDITDRDSLRHALKDREVVFHLAALIAIPYSYVAPLSYVRTNVEGTLNVLQCAREAGVGRIVHTSTSEVYGTARRVPIAEDHPLQGQSPYSASKIGADKIAEAFSLSYGMEIVTVRPFNTFGPRQSGRAIIPTIVTQCLSGDRIRLGSLHPTRDLNYVANTVDGFLLAGATQAAAGCTVNLGSGREISIGELAQLIARMMGRTISIEEDEQRCRPEGSEVERLLADSSLADRMLGWRPTITLEEGLERTIGWIKENPGIYRSGIYAI